MKKQLMVMLVLGLMSSHAFAITGKDNWRDIRSSTDLMIQQPAFAKAFGPQGLFNACATEDELRSKTPVSRCLTYKDNECVEVEKRKISIARTHVENVCVRHDTINGECLDYADVTAVYPTSFQLAVIEAQENINGEFIFSKTFALPACK